MKKLSLRLMSLKKSVTFFISLYVRMTAKKCISRLLVEIFVILSIYHNRYRNVEIACIIDSIALENII